MRANLELRRFTGAEVARLAEAGVFGADERLERLSAISTVPPGPAPLRAQLADLGGERYPGRAPGALHVDASVVLEVATQALTWRSRSLVQGHHGRPLRRRRM